MRNIKIHNNEFCNVHFQHAITGVHMVYANDLSVVIEDASPMLSCTSCSDLHLKLFTRSKP